jgi:hypothetical protein
MRVQGPNDRIEDELDEAVWQESVVGVLRYRSELRVEDVVEEREEGISAKP